MVHDRAHYLKAAMESLSLSDFPNATVPVIISHDGKVPEVVDYVNSLKEEGGFRVIQLFHPFACYDHPNDFPGNDTGLNEGYEGDSYGNPRTWSVTCAKHHFTWLLTTVFAMDFGDGVVDNFLFMEEDYVVAPTVYSTIIGGLNAMDQFSNLTSSGFLGVGLVAGKMQKVSRFRTSSFNAAAFTTGPMTLSRDVFLKLQASPSDYCLVDEYNWDWSIVHTAYLGHLPHTMIFPGKQQAMHIGVEGGMHNELLSAQDRRKALAKDPFDLKFAGTDFCDLGAIPMIQHSKGFGGWGHAKDMSHCLSFFSNNTAQIKALVRGVLERNHEAKEAVAPGTRTAQKNNPHLPQKVKSVLPQEVKPGLPEITVRDFSVNQTVVPFVSKYFLGWLTCSL